MKGADFILYIGVTIFAVATVFGTADLFKSPWPALAVIGIWVMIATWIKQEIDDMKKGGQS